MTEITGYSREELLNSPPSLYIKEESDVLYDREAGTSGPWSGIDLNADTPWTIGSGMRSGVRRGYLDGIVDEVRISRKPLAPQDFLVSVIPEPGLFIIYYLSFIIYWRKFIPMH